MRKYAIAVLACTVMALLTGGVGVASAKPARYMIGPGDVLEISVWKDDSLSRNVIVPPDGVVSFPLIGDIDVSNMTVTVLRETVRKRLSEYVPDATVTVLLTQINSLKAYVIGKVNRPGQFSIGLDTTVMQVLSMAGGLDPYANEGKISILRQSNGQTVQLPFDYKDVVKGEELKQNIHVEAGDVIVVP